MLLTNKNCILKNLSGLRPVQLRVGPVVVLHLVPEEVLPVTLLLPLLPAHPDQIVLVLEGRQVAA